MNTCKNFLYTMGTLTIKVFVHPEEKNGRKIYHGTTRVATIKNIHQDDVIDRVNLEIQKYLSKCKFKNAERTFSWKFETW